MRTLFFIHGMWSTPRVWDHYSSYFADLGYKVHCPALPQHFTFNQAEQLDNLGLNDFLQHLLAEYRKVPGDAVIIGHSMGALLACQLAEKVKARGLVLLAPAPPAGTALFEKSALKTLAKTMARPMFWRGGFKPDQQAANYGLFNQFPESERAKHYNKLSFESGRALFEIALWYLDKKRAAMVGSENINCPVLTLAGEHDRLVPVKVARRISQDINGNSQFHRLPNHAHWLVSEPGWEDIARQMHVWLCWQLTSRSAAA